MTVLLLDERWPELLPASALGKLRGPALFTAEVPVSVRWGFSDFLGAEDPSGAGTLVSTDANDEQVRERVTAGEDVIEVASRRDPLLQAQQVMRAARRRGEWERAQTHASLLPYLREETEEFGAAVTSRAGGDELLSELGDVLLQVLFHAEIAAERGSFALGDVASSFVRKMRSRAPYLFDGSVGPVPEEEQQRLWARGKEREGEENR